LRVAGRHVRLPGVDTILASWRQQSPTSTPPWMVAAPIATQEDCLAYLASGIGTHIDAWLPRIGSQPPWALHAPLSPHTPTTTVLTGPVPRSVRGGGRCAWQQRCALAYPPSGAARDAHRSLPYFVHVLHAMRDTLAFVTHVQRVKDTAIILRHHCGTTSDTSEISFVLRNHATRLDVMVRARAYLTCIVRPLSAPVRHQLARSVQRMLQHHPARTALHLDREVVEWTTLHALFHPEHRNETETETETETISRDKDNQLRAATIIVTMLCAVDNESDLFARNDEMSSDRSHLTALRWLRHQLVGAPSSSTTAIAMQFKPIMN